MPIYEYQCTSCNDKFEIIQKFFDDPLTICKKCNGRLIKLVSNTSFCLKGKGWYKDAYSGESNNKPNLPVKNKKQIS